MDMEKEEKIKNKILFKQIIYLLTLLLFISTTIIISNWNKPSVAFAGVSKGIKEDQIHAIVDKLSKLGDEIFSDYHFYIYDNDSTPSQKEAWKKALEGGRGTFISEPGPVGPLTRTARMAIVRNKMLDMIDKNKFEYLWIQDLDGVCGGVVDDKNGYSPTVFKKLFNRQSEWDVVSFMYLPYWDMWAFRHPTLFPHNMYGPWFQYMGK